MGFSPIFFCGGRAEGMTKGVTKGVNMGVADIIEQAVVGLGYEVADFETSPRARLLRVFIDVPSHDRGVTIEDCTAVSNHLSRLLLVENVDFDRLEVSSPGLDRPLKKPADFMRFAGQEVALRLRLPVDNQRNFAGVLLGLADDKVRVNVAGKEMSFDLSQLDKARLVPKF